MLTATYIINQYTNSGYLTICTDVRGVACVYNPSVRPYHFVVICDNRSNYIWTKANTAQIKRVIKESIRTPDDVSEDMIFLILNNWKESALIGKDHIHINIHDSKVYHGRRSSSLKDEYRMLFSILHAYQRTRVKDELKHHLFCEGYKVWVVYFLAAVTAFAYQYTAGKAKQYGFSPDSVLIEGEYGRMISYLFIHGNILHLVGNIAALLVIGRLLEQRIGAAKLLGIYFLSGISGAIVSMGYSAAQSYTVGASGAIYGLFSALIIKVIMDKKYEKHLSVPILMVTLIFSLFASVRLVGTDNLCHIGGVAAGCIFMVIFNLCDMIESAVRSIRLQQYFNRRIIFRDGQKI